ncbi:nitrate reductase cytochrome c-type subunit [Shewanella avicenniae]|uniref:Periplasmic nitrate reductase, electron transfer subunit n=1 Tax=Shewanella avicenniae TaxID=2814294 RepID=A0ABX7QS36_9GAMM|nr:nitrate reductase cytochrome c-type subunit [Shewanella avicenniae]QSX34274.1 nitrate reductase cytochrome c-type subunit [Shewanella avicenniae]
MKKLVTLAALLLLSACSGQQTQATNQAAAPVNVQSLAGNHVVTDTIPAAEMATYPKKGSAISRNFAAQPPLIPHKADYSINRDRNSCMSCHSWDKAERMKATPVAKSHVIDAQGTLNGQNYFCTQCHVPQADNKTALVGNSYKM